MTDEIGKRRIQKLTDKGIGLFEEGKYQEALLAAHELEDAKGLLAPYIAGQAYAGMQDMKGALAEMKRGVLMAPHFWVNWFFYGHYLGNLGRKDAALAAYEQALLCPAVDADLIHLNMAIQLENAREYEKALTVLDAVQNPAMRWGIDGTRILALEGVGRLTEAAELAEGFLRDRPDGDEQYSKRVGFVAAALARIRLRQGTSAGEIRSFLMEHLDEHGCNFQVLAEIRNLNPTYHKDAKRYRMVIGATIPLGHPWRRTAGGYAVLYDVVAGSMDEALDIIGELESRVGVETLEIVDAKEMEAAPDEPVGVYFFTERCF